MIEEVSTRSWHVCLVCGRELHGREMGSFAQVKHRRDILDLWVETRKGRVYAERSMQERPLGFDFYVHIAVDEDGRPEKHWKLITLYRGGRKVIKHVLPDGRAWTEHC